MGVLVQHNVCGLHTSSTYALISCFYQAYLYRDRARDIACLHGVWRNLCFHLSLSLIELIFGLNMRVKPLFCLLWGIRTCLVIGLWYCSTTSESISWVVYKCGTFEHSSIFYQGAPNVSEAASAIASDAIQFVLILLPCSVKYRNMIVRCIPEHQSLILGYLFLLIWDNSGSIYPFSTFQAC